VQNDDAESAESVPNTVPQVPAEMPTNRIHPGMLALLR